jgi:exodeoxyribonuclease-3
MLVACWNVNSIRARSEKVIAWLNQHQPDVLCMQELKTEEKDFPALEFKAAGYDVVAAFQKTYNGVAIASKKPLTDVRFGLEDGVDDPQARLVAATVDGVRVYSVYIPNGQEVGSEPYAYKLAWLDRLRVHLATQKLDGPVCVCGDFNVAADERDVYDPTGWANQTLFHATSRDALARLSALGFADTFRKHHAEGGVYSWWDYRMLGFQKNRGLRIDYIFATETLAARCTDAWIDRDARKGKGTSDHAPVLARFALPCAVR